MKLFPAVLIALLLLARCSSEQAPVLPSPGQVKYQQMEMVGFIHFTVNTFTDKEWGYGDEDPAIFDPSALDPEQWARVAKAGGMKQLILTAKHHDGFCLWPSAYTGHSVKNSPYKDGKGDVVREFVDACRKHGLKVGLYLSPWDRNHAGYGTPTYIEYYRNQLQELLTNYGEINEIWFDGANGGDGWYGGADEERRIDRETYYDWPATIAMVKELQPGIKIFSDGGPDIRWVGNEEGHAGETFWSTIDDSKLVIGASDPEYLNIGDPDGNRWITGQCDVSIRPGWFYHPEEDSLVKTPEELLDIYYKSVGRNGVLLLNLPPDRRGLIHENDSAHLAEFKSIIDGIFAEDLAEGAPLRVLDKSASTLDVELQLDRASTFDHIVLSEPIEKGQRVSRFLVEAETAPGRWREIALGTTIGYKRILVTEPVTTERIRLVVKEALHSPEISRIGLYHSPERPDR